MTTFAKIHKEMTAVRDSVGIALPFAAGTASGILLAAFITPHGGGAIASCALILTSAATLTLLRSARSSKALYSRILIWAMLFSTGVFVVFTRNIWSGYCPGQARNPFTLAAGHCAQSLKALIDSMPYSDGQTAALVKALLTGDRSGLDASTREAFRLSGASHLLALSGMHLGIIYMIIGKLLSCLGNGKRTSAVRSAVIVAASGFFTLMTGASPSIVRAFLFILINEAASVTGRAKDGVHTLCMALFIQLASAPELMASVGFQLSYLAMCGILFLFPVMKRWYPEDGRRGIMGRIWNAAALSISCQAFTAPVVWYHFGTFPQYFMLTNLLAIPLTTMTMVTSVAAVALSAMGICPDFLLTANEAAVAALRFTLETISTL